MEKAHLIMRTTPFGSFLTTGRMNVKLIENAGFSGLVHSSTLSYAIFASKAAGAISRLKRIIIFPNGVADYGYKDGQVVLQRWPSEVCSECLSDSVGIVFYHISQLEELVLSVCNGSKFSDIGTKLAVDLCKESMVSEA